MSSGENGVLHNLDLKQWQPQPQAPLPCETEAPTPHLSHMRRRICDNRKHISQLCTPTQQTKKTFARKETSSSCSLHHLNTSGFEGNVALPARVRRGGSDLAFIKVRNPREGEETGPRKICADAQKTMGVVLPADVNRGTRRARIHLGKAQ